MALRTPGQEIFRGAARFLQSSNAQFSTRQPGAHFRSPKHPGFGAVFAHEQQDELGEQLNEARKWHTSFQESSLPQGSTGYSRSSGPGGQHINKTESKAMTAWSVKELAEQIPRVMHAALKKSRYYTSRTDSITMQAQIHRSRDANKEENRQKLFGELERIYKETVPGETSEKKKKKHEALEKSFHENRLKAKKAHSSKKASRKGFSGG